MGGGTTSGNGSEGAALAEEAAEIEGSAGVGGDLRFVHRESRRQTGHRVRSDVMRFVDSKQVKWRGGRKNRPSMSGLPFQPSERVAPLVPCYDRSVRDLGGGEGGKRISGLGGMGYGDEKY